MRTAVLLALFSGSVAAGGFGQGHEQHGRKCGDAHHYRWAQKTDASLADETAISVDLLQILETWAAPQLPADDWCAPRQGNEHHVYRVVGWVRVVRHEVDLDWHIELTATATGSLKRCIIAEIPRIKYSPLFQSARESLSTYLGNSEVDSRGHVTPPVQLRFVGAAFFDGWHLTHGNHGDCNVQPGGLWELHPVFRVEMP